MTRYQQDRSTYNASSKIQSAASSWKQLRSPANPLSIGLGSRNMPENMLAESSKISMAMTGSSSHRHDRSMLLVPSAGHKSSKSTHQSDSMRPHHKSSKSTTTTSSSSLPRRASRKKTMNKDLPKVPTFPSYSNTHHHKNISLTINTSNHLPQSSSSSRKAHERNLSYTPSLAPHEKLDSHPNQVHKCKSDLSHHPEHQTRHAAGAAARGTPNLSIQPIKYDAAYTLELPAPSPLVVDLPKFSPLAAKFQNTNLDHVLPEGTAPSPARDHAPVVPPSPALPRIRNIESFRLQPLAALSPTVGGSFSQLEREISSYKYKESPVATAAPLLPVPPKINHPESFQAADQRRISSYVQEDDSYTVDDNDCTIQQWVSVSEGVGRWNYTPSPLTPISRAHTQPLFKLADAAGTDSQVTLTQNDMLMPPPSSSPAPRTPTNGFSRFVLSEISQLDRAAGNVSQIQLATIPQSPDDADADDLTQVTQVASPTLSTATFEYTDHSSVATTMTSSASTNTTATSGSAVDWCSGAVSVKSADSDETTGGDNVFFDCQSQLAQRSATSLVSAPAAVAPAPTTKSIAQRTGIKLAVSTEQPPSRARELESVKHTHGVVWVGEEVANYYIPTPACYHPPQSLPQPNKAGTVPASKPVDASAADSILSRVYYDFETADSDLDEDEDDSVYDGYEFDDEDEDEDVTKVETFFPTPAHSRYLVKLK